MTKEQYEADSDYFLSEEEKDKQKNLNSKNDYGLSTVQLISLINKHKKARKQENFDVMASIEYRLTDINFHSECADICLGNYEKLLEQLTRERDDLFEI